jgi:hypothetical protein
VTSADQLLAFFQAGGWRLAQMSALQEASDTAEGISKLNLEVSLEEAKDGYTWPLFAQFAEAQPILWGEIEKVLSRQKEPQDARVDGGSTLRVMLQIALPLIQPGLAATAVLAFLWTWNDLLVTLVLSIRTNTEMLPLGLTKFVLEYGVD